MPGPDQDSDGSGVRSDLGVQELEAAGQGAQAGRGGDVSVSQALSGGASAGADQARRGEIPQPTAEGIGSSNDQRVELALAVGGGLDGRAGGGQPHRQRRPVPSGPWLGELVAAQGLAGRPDRIQGVGPGAVAAGGPLGPVQLSHLLGLTMEVAGQPGAVAAGASIAHTRWPGC